MLSSSGLQYLRESFEHLHRLLPGDEELGIRVGTRDVEEDAGHPVPLLLVHAHDDGIAELVHELARVGAHGISIASRSQVSGKVYATMLRFVQQAQRSLNC